MLWSIIRDNKFDNTIVRPSFMGFVNNQSYAIISDDPRCNELEIDDLIWPMTAIGKTATVNCPWIETGDHLYSYIAVE